MHPGQPDVLLLRHSKPLAERNNAGCRLLQEHQRRDQSPAQQVHRKAFGKVSNPPRAPCARRSPLGTPGSAQGVAGFVTGAKEEHARFDYLIVNFIL